ncbi:MAG: BON domain-containing protein [Rubrobacteraceae bacterium]
MFGSKANTNTKTDVAKAILKSRTGRKAVAKGAKGSFRLGRSDGGQAAGKAGAKGIGRLARGAAKAKAGKEAGKAGTKGLAKVGRGASKYAAKRGKKEIKIAEKNLNSGGSGGSRLLKFGLLVIAGLSIGALVGRLMSSQESQQDESPSTGASGQDGSSSSGSSGQSSTSEADLPRGHSDPSSGPLIGSDHDANIEGVTEDQPELEQRIRTSIGEDERTRDMPRVNVEVSDGVAELRGEAASEDAKDAAGEIAASVEGISEVRNLIEVNS